MVKDIFIDGDYLNIPVCPGKEEKKLQIFLLDEGIEKENQKIYELMVPVDESQKGDYVCNFYAQIPMGELREKELRVSAEMTEAFAGALQVGNRYLGADEKKSRPVIHFAADNGWTNDPNGLIYDKGIYHLYFQYNPFNTEWNNMSWGHAISVDLLHWTQVDSVMFPDEEGTIFSGCAIKNEQGLLDLPDDALLFYYTAAGGSSEWSEGKQYTQKIAYSLDCGKTLTKIKKPCIPVIYKDSRDPKVYWHELSKGYVMVLWLKENDFALFRSNNLRDWKMTDQFTLKDAWECPDIFELSSEEGEKCWFFWSADGFYYTGEFDGYRFKTDGVKHHAYLNGIPYAAQTYSGVSDRIISVPWLRFKNDGRDYTGVYGLPVELACKKSDKGFIIVQKPVCELMEQAIRITDSLLPDENNVISYYQKDEKKALVIQMKMKEDSSVTLYGAINGSKIEYTPENGSFVVDNETYQTMTGLKNLLFVIDDRILEVFFDDGVQFGTFELSGTEVSVEMMMDTVQGYEIYQVE